MFLDEEALRFMELSREWQAGYDQGCEDSNLRNDYLVQDLLKEIERLKIKLSEFINSDGTRP